MATMAVAVVAVLLVIWYLEEDERGERVWRQYQQQQEARGEPLNRFAFIPPLVPDAENFAATPYLAPLFDFLPGTQQPRDRTAVPSLETLAPRYAAAVGLVKSAKQARSNSWVGPALDLTGWYAAFVKGTNWDAESVQAEEAAFRVRYGLAPRRSAVPPARPASLKPQLSTNVPSRAEAAAGVLAALADAEPVLEELRSASRRPHSRFNLRYDTDDPGTVVLPHYVLLKQVCQVLQLRASAELALGQTEPAFEDINLIFRVTDAIWDEPFPLAHLVRVTELQSGLQPLEEGLARHQWSAPQLRAFEARLRQFDFLADGWQALEGERVLFGGTFIDYVRRSPHRWELLANLADLTGEGRDARYSWQSALLGAAPRGWYYLEKVNYSRAFEDYLLSSINVPGRQVSPEACRRFDEHLSAMVSHPAPMVVLRHQFFCGFLLLAISRTPLKFAFGQTGADAAALACALERYRLAHGQFPPVLEALVPEIVSQLPHDIINGQPLKYRLTPDGQYLLYSVGWNETDEGGVVGLTKSGEGVDPKTGDWVWRLVSLPGT